MIHAIGREIANAFGRTAIAFGTPAFFGTNSIFVRTDRPSYVGGQNVTGTVYLNVKTPITTDGVYLRVQGVEEVSFNENKTRDTGRKDDYGQPIKETYVHKDRNQYMFFQTRVPVYFVSGALNPGQYSIPFTFTLPSDLPGSFYEETQDKRSDQDGYYRAAVSYTVAAECVSTQLFSFGSHTLESQCEMVIHAKLLSSIVGVTRQANATIRSWCCINQGVVSMRASFEKNAYMSGETAHVLLQFDNQSTVDINSFQIKLFRSFKMTGRDGQFSRVQCLRSEKYPGIGAGQNTGDAARVISLELMGERGALAPQTRGRLVQCEYWIQVHIPVPCGSGDIDQDLPITVYAPQATIEQWTITPPPSWNPTVVQQAHVDVHAPPQYSQTPQAPPSYEQQHAPQYQQQQQQQAPQHQQRQQHQEQYSHQQYQQQQQAPQYQQQQGHQYQQPQGPQYQQQQVPPHGYQSTQGPAYQQAGQYGQMPPYGQAQQHYR
ncbi:Arrestin C-terminal-like domain-containing protein [Plasmodiophora brassicae]